VPAAATVADDDAHFHDDDDADDVRAHVSPFRRR